MYILAAGKTDYFSIYKRVLEEGVSVISVFHGMETKPTLGFPSFSRVIAEFICEVGDAGVFTGALNIGSMINDQLRKLGAEPLATSARGCN